MSVLDLVPVHDLEMLTTYEGRQYVTPDGAQYPSVTTVLGRQPKPELEAWKDSIGHEEAKKQVRQSVLIGNALHSLCENYLLKQPLPLTRQTPRWMFNRLRPELNKIEVVRGVELPLWSDFLKVAGRTDCVGVYDNQLSIIDFKNSKKHKEARYIEDYFLQSTCYAMMFMSVYNIAVHRIVILVATWDGSVQVFTEPVSKRIDKVVDIMREYNELW